MGSAFSKKKKDKKAQQNDRLQRRLTIAGGGMVSADPLHCNTCTQEHAHTRSERERGREGEGRRGTERGGGERGRERGRERESERERQRDIETQRQLDRETKTREDTPLTSCAATHKGAGPLVGRPIGGAGAVVRPGMMPMTLVQWGMLTAARLKDLLAFLSPDKHSVTHLHTRARGLASVPGLSASNSCLLKCSCNAGLA